MTVGPWAGGLWQNPISDWILIYFCPQGLEKTYKSHKSFSCGITFGTPPSAQLLDTSQAIDCLIWQHDAAIYHMTVKMKNTMKSAVVNQQTVLEVVSEGTLAGEQVKGQMVQESGILDFHWMDQSQRM